LHEFWLLHQEALRRLCRLATKTLKMTMMTRKVPASPRHRTAKKEHLWVEEVPKLT
jgi:hypothetical protein